MKTVAITGSTGLVGSRIVELLKDTYSFLPLQYPQCDITDKKSVTNVLKDKNFDLLLHLAAYTNVDGAEKEKETAYKINVEGTKNMMEVAAEHNAKLMYISTDFVFDGTNPPYTEDSRPNPVGYYGETKYEGEKIVNGRGMIIRIAYPYRREFSEKKDFVRSLRSLLEAGKELQMVTDSLMTPTFIDDIAIALDHLMSNFSPEIYHIVGSESMSPFDAAKAIAKAFHLNEALVKPSTFAEYSKNKAPRPKLSEMKSVKNTFHKMMGLSEGLARISL